MLENFGMVIYTFENDNPNLPSYSGQMATSLEEAVQFRAGRVYAMEPVEYLADTPVLTSEVINQT